MLRSASHIGVRVIYVPEPKCIRSPFPPVRDRLEGLSPGARMSADVLIMQNIPSREG